MMDKIFTWVAFAFVGVLSLGQTVVTPVEIQDGEFSVKQVTERVLYSAVGESIEANGKSYFAFESEPVKVPAVDLEVSGNTVDWVVIWKSGSTGLPTKLKSYKPNRYLFEHQGAGLYYLQTQSLTGEPEFAEFTVGETPTDPTDPDPTDPPPSGELEKLLTEIPIDAVTARALSKAYLSVAELDLPLEQLKSRAEQARKEALRSVPPLKVNWNDWLLSVSDYVNKLSLAEYKSALKAIGAKLGEQKLDAVSQAIETPVRQLITIHREPVIIEPSCPSGVCPTPSRQRVVLFRR
jgi:hypothetical protein